jgi:hypothetical protein
MFQYAPGAASARTSAFPGSLFGVSSSPAPLASRTALPGWIPVAPIIAWICVTTETTRNPAACWKLLLRFGPRTPPPRKRGREHRTALSLAVQGGYSARAIAISHNAEFSRGSPTYRASPSIGTTRRFSRRSSASRAKVRTNARAALGRAASERERTPARLPHQARRPGRSLFRRVSRDSRPPCSSRARACGTPGDTAVATRSSAVLVATGTCEITPLNGGQCPIVVPGVKYFQGGVRVPHFGAHILGRDSGCPRYHHS